jgi:alkanesulfonate monooxygenase SsuD/methylene tetrahydromethanopterin reductase-like flavin-dependent oxidoreductase (luciferase family)
MPSSVTAETTLSRKSRDKGPIPRTLLSARFRNQISIDSGISPRFKPGGKRSKPKDFAKMSQRTRRPLKVGFVVPVFEHDSGHAPRWNEIKAVAQHAEAAGFDSLWVPDHLIFDLGDPGRPPRGVWECWSILSSLAAVTTHIELGTFVICTSFRNPALLAKMADTVDEISGGRLILGLGAGYHELEFRTYGYPFDHLVGRFEESLHIIHSLLRNGKVDFQGQYYTTRECELRPRGPTRQGPPIMISGRPDRPRALRLTAQYADYWNIFAVNQVENVVPALDALDVACSKAGRDPATLQRTVAVLVDLPGSESDASTGGFSKMWASRTPATGTSEQLAELLRNFAREGVDQVQLVATQHTQPTEAAIEALSPVLEILDRG